MSYLVSTKVDALHRDLALKYERHFPRVQKIWRASNQVKRGQYLRAGAHGGFIPDNPLALVDTESLILDVTWEKSEYLLDVLTHRATKSLEEQFWEDVDGGPGDYDVMEAAEYDLHYQYGACYTYFTNDLYGETRRISEESREEILNTFDEDIEAGVLVPAALGDLVLRRQLSMLKDLNEIFDVILDGKSGRKRQGRGSGKRKVRNTGEDESTAPTLQGLTDCAEEYKAYGEVQLSRLHTVPTVLHEAVEAQVLSRAENVPDKYGATAPSSVGHVERDVFEAVHAQVRVVAF
jgi:hypothetical protein